MTDIRPIREAESEQFLRVLCDVFKLDFNSAFDVFYSEPYYNPARKWALFDGPEMLSILTLTPLEFGWGKAVGIAGVATPTRHQGEGHASRLIERVLRESERNGEGAALLFAQDCRIYDKNGFETLDRVIHAPVMVHEDHDESVLPGPSVRTIYNEWAAQHPDRLRRGEKAWEYWDWHYRMCSPFQTGYICHEVNTLREAIYTDPAESLPLPKGTEWFGTTLMADTLQIPVYDARVELYLMGYRVPGIPQMFMTDQF